MKLLFIGSLTLVCGLELFAQTPAQPEKANGCEQYKMRVKEAPSELDNQMLRPESAGSKMARGRVIDPCAANRNRSQGGVLIVVPDKESPSQALPNPLMRNDQPLQPIKPPSELSKPKIPLVIPKKK